MLALTAKAALNEYFIWEICKTILLIALVNIKWTVASTWYSRSGCWRAPEPVSPSPAAGRVGLQAEGDPRRSRHWSRSCTAGRRRAPPTASGWWRSCRACWRWGGGGGWLGVTRADTRCCWDTRCWRSPPCPPPCPTSGPSSAPTSCSRDWLTTDWSIGGSLSTSSAYRVSPCWRWRGRSPPPGWPGSCCSGWPGSSRPAPGWRWSSRQTPGSRASSGEQRQVSYG